MFDETEGRFTLASMLVAELIRLGGVSEALANEAVANSLACMFGAEQGDEEALKLCQVNRTVMELQWGEILGKV